MIGTARGYAHFTEIRQPPQRVFAAFTEPAQLALWYAVEAIVEPRQGGMFRVRLKDSRVRDATLDVWDPGRRLRLIYLADPLLPPNDAGPLVEDVLFDVKAGTTVVRVLGNGVPASREWDAEFRWLGRAWIYWLDGLKHLLEAEPSRSATRR